MPYSCYESSSQQVWLQGSCISMVTGLLVQRQHMARAARGRGSARQGHGGAPGLGAGRPPRWLCIYSVCLQKEESKAAVVQNRVFHLSRDMLLA